jgi:hypothetical protein
VEARAAVLVAERTLEIQTFTVPDVLGDGEALLKIEGTGTCGSDVEQYHGATARLGIFETPTAKSLSWRNVSVRRSRWMSSRKTLLKPFVT